MESGPLRGALGDLARDPHGEFQGGGSFVSPDFGLGTGARSR
jgi:hypothetical protein